MLVTRRKENMKNKFFPERPVLFLGELAASAGISRVLMRQILQDYQVAITKHGSRDAIMFAELLKKIPFLVESILVVTKWKMEANNDRRPTDP